MDLHHLLINGWNYKVTFKARDAAGRQQQQVLPRPELRHFWDAARSQNDGAASGGARAGPLNPGPARTASRTYWLGVENFFPLAISFPRS